MITPERKSFLKEISECKQCKIAEMERQRRDSATGTTAICSYHYDKGLKTK